MFTMQDRAQSVDNNNLIFIRISNKYRILAVANTFVDFEN